MRGSRPGHAASNGENVLPSQHGKVGRPPADLSAGDISAPVQAGRGERPVETSAQFSRLYAHSRAALLRFHVPKRPELIASVILNLSYRIGQERACIDRLEAFTDYTGIARPDVWRALRWLSQHGIIQADTRSGTYTFLPDCRHWLARARNIKPQHYQMVCPEVMHPADSLNQAVSEISREAALCGGSVGEPPTIRGAKRSVTPQELSPNALGQSEIRSSIGNPPTTSLPGYPAPEIPDLPGGTRSEAVGASRVSVGRSPTKDYEIFLMDCLDKLLGKEEMTRNGGLWRVRIREDSSAMREAMSQLKLNLGGVANPAAYLTTTYKTERARRQNKERDRAGHGK